MWLSAAQYLLRRGPRDNRRCGQGDYGPRAGRRGQGGRPSKAGQRVLRVRLDLVVCQRAQVCPLKALLQYSSPTFSCQRKSATYLVQVSDMHTRAGN